LYFDTLILKKAGFWNENQTEPYRLFSQTARTTLLDRLFHHFVRAAILPVLRLLLGLVGAKQFAVAISFSMQLPAC
jgi:hypothetical protein